MSKEALSIYFFGNKPLLSRMAHFERRAYVLVLILFFTEILNLA